MLCITRAKQNLYVHVSFSSKIDTEKPTHYSIKTKIYIFHEITDKLYQQGRSCNLQSLQLCMNLGLCAYKISKTVFKSNQGTI